MKKYKICVFLINVVLLRGALLVIVFQMFEEISDSLFAGQLHFFILLTLE